MTILFEAIFFLTIVVAACWASLVGSRLVATSFVLAVVIAASFAAARLLAAIACWKGLAATLPGVVAREGLANQIAAMRNGAMRIVAGKTAEIRRKGTRLKLVLAHRIEIVGYGFFFVESDVTGVGAHETLVEDAAGSWSKCSSSRARSMRVLILVVPEMASRPIPCSSRCLRSFSPNAPKCGSGGRVFRPTIIIGEGGGGC